MDRRKFLTMLPVYAAGGAAALTEAGCSQTDVSAFQTELATIIDTVQKGVASACASAGKWVPFASSVVSVLVSELPAGTAITAAAEAIIQAAINTIAAVCPAAPTPAPTAEPVGPVKTAKGVNVHFY